MSGSRRTGGAFGTRGGRRSSSSVKARWSDSTPLLGPPVLATASLSVQMRSCFPEEGPVFGSISRSGFPPCSRALQLSSSGVAAAVSYPAIAAPGHCTSCRYGLTGSLKRVCPAFETTIKTHGSNGHTSNSPPPALIPTPCLRNHRQPRRKARLWFRRHFKGSPGVFAPVYACPCGATENTATVDVDTTDTPDGDTTPVFPVVFWVVVPLPG